jgi:hypothetical protein
MSLKLELKTSPLERFKKRFRNTDFGVHQNSFAASPKSSVRKQLINTSQHVYGMETFNKQHAALLCRQTTRRNSVSRK